MQPVGFLAGMISCDEMLTHNLIRRKLLRRLMLSPLLPRLTHDPR
jgi:hypothetical protein